MHWVLGLCAILLYNAKCTMPEGTEAKIVGCIAAACIGILAGMAGRKRHV